MRGVYGGCLRLPVAASPLSIALLLSCLFWVIYYCSLVLPATLSMTSSAPASSSSSDSAQQIVAVNVCLLPPASHPLHERAVRYNELLHSLFPSSFLFSLTRRPHVTLVQAFVLTSSLPALVAVITAAVSSPSPSLAVSLRGSELAAGPLQEGVYVPSIAIERTPELQRLHSLVLAAVHPFRVSASQSSAASLRSSFYREEGEADINDSTLQWVDRFELNSAEQRYFPHITIGTASEEALQKLRQQEAEEKTASGGQSAQSEAGWTVNRVSVFQLGNSGTVRKQMHEIAM